MSVYGWDSGYISDVIYQGSITSEGHKPLQVRVTNDDFQYTLIEKKTNTNIYFNLIRNFHRLSKPIFL